MIQATLNQVGHAVNAITHNHLMFNGVSIDSRNIEAGNLFIAIKGAQFDGHQYINKAIKQGAVAIVADHEIGDCSVPVLVVHDTREALGQIAKYWRASNNWLVVAITGSNGKTSVKEMARCVLSEKYITQATQGNLNNDFGVPLTILATPAKTEALVVEMGANHLGEIAYLTDIAKPDIALVNNITSAHIEGFGSLEGVAQAKAEIYSGLKAKGIVVINSDDHYANYLKNKFNQSFIDFSIKSNATVSAKNIQNNQFDIAYLTQSANVNLSLHGLHNVANALAAVSIGLAAGLDVMQSVVGLKKYSGVKGRLQLKVGLNQSTLIDDTYNANVASMKAGIDYLVSLEGQKWLLVGSMAELGDASNELHKELATYALKQGVDKLYVVGKEGELMCKTFGNNCEYDLQGEHLAEQIASGLTADVNLLIKGSRSAAMEQYVAQLGGVSC